MQNYSPIIRQVYLVTYRKETTSWQVGFIPEFQTCSIIKEDWDGHICSTSTM